MSVGSLLIVNIDINFHLPLFRWTIILTVICSYMITGLPVLSRLTWHRYDIVHPHFDDFIPERIPYLNGHQRLWIRQEKKSTIFQRIPFYSSF